MRPFDVAWWSEVWDHTNAYLSAHPLAEFALEALLTGAVAASLYFMKTTRTWIATLWRRLRDDILCAHVFPFLGLATRKELNDLVALSMEKMDERIAKQLSSQVSPSVSGNATLDEDRIVERFGVKVRVTKSAWSYLRTDDDARMSDELIGRLLQGPFCPSCMVNLVFWDGRRVQYMMSAECPACHWKWKGNDGRAMELAEFKKAIFRVLSAEVRRTGTLVDAEAQPAATPTT
jgi:hypothetical protein